MMAAAVQLRDRISGLRGWRRIAALIALGALSATALPPFHAVPILVPTLVGFLWSLGRHRSIKRGFASGFWFGFGLNTVALYWVSLALLVDPRFAWMIPVVVIGLGGLMALYTGLVGIAVASVRDGPKRVIVFAAAWILMEWVRSWAFTGFPWNMTATVWAFDAAPLQPAAWIGSYGLGFVTILMAAAPAMLAMSQRVAVRRVTILLAAILIAWVGISVLRLNQATDAYFAGVTLRLVQPNIAQRDKWVPELRPRHVVDQAVLSQNLGLSPPTAVIWAETAAPYDLTREPRVRELIGNALGANSIALVGALGSTAVQGGKPLVHNSLFALAPSGEILSRYDKAHLVPFGEYVPLRDVLPLKKITAGRGSFEPGPGLQTLSLPGLPPFAPLICYEIIFSGAVVNKQARPSWLLNITNDGWFGYSTGPYQHFASAILRAVEEGLPVVRVANTGISGVIDAHGNVIQRLGLLERGTIDTRLPVALAPTPFARFGPVLSFGLIAALTFIWAVLSRPANRRKRQNL